MQPQDSKQDFAPGPDDGTFVKAKGEECQFGIGCNIIELRPSSEMEVILSILLISLNSLSLHPLEWHNLKTFKGH